MLNSASNRITCLVMSFSVFLVKILEYMFLAGWAGSALVLLITAVEDVETLLDRKDEVNH